MATAMIRCLRRAFPHARIDMAVRSDFAELLGNNPHLDRIHTIDRSAGVLGLWRLYRELSRERYDLVYDAHFSIRSIILSTFLGATKTIRFEKNYVRRSLALTFKLPLLAQIDRMLVRYIDPLKSLGVGFDNVGPELFLAPDVTQVPTQVPGTIGLIPSAQWPGKRYSQSNFRRLLDLIVSRTSWKVIVFGGTQDHFCTDIVSGFSTDRVTNTQGTLGITGAARELKKCAFVIANDTGLMHMADALSIPSLVILGPTSKEMGCLPFHPKSRVAERRDLWCRPCSKNGQAPCIRGHRHCLDIDPQLILQTALQMAEAVA